MIIKYLIPRRLFLEAVPPQWWKVSAELISFWSKAEQELIFFFFSNVAHSNWELFFPKVKVKNFKAKCYGHTYENKVYINNSWKQFLT